MSILDQYPKWATLLSPAPQPHMRMRCHPMTCNSPHHIRHHSDSIMYKHICHMDLDGHPDLLPLGHGNWVRLQHWHLEMNVAYYSQENNNNNAMILDT